MSITIGKRSFNETISELSHERILHQQADFRRSKNNLNSNDSTFEMLQSKQKNLLNLEALFPNKSKNVSLFFFSLILTNISYKC